MIKRLLLWSILILIAVFAAAFFYIDSIVKNGIEVVGSEVLGTSVSVSSVSISPLSGSGTIRGLSIENPEGFTADSIMELGEVTVSLNISSLLSDVIEIYEISIIEPAITYETKITTDNIRALLANLPSTSVAANEGVAADAGKELIIKEFNLKDAQVNLIASIIEQSFALGDIQLLDIGTEKQAATVSQALEKILGAVSTRILNAEMPGLNDLREAVEGRLQDGVQQAEEAVGQGVEEISSRLRNILN
ncbi:MAG: hypothetical protein ACJA2Q_001198 [Pseudohongiellaceae bacterium]|jgi:hypothetical protein